LAGDFHNQNNRNLFVEIENCDCPLHHLAKIRIRLQRSVEDQAQIDELWIKLPTGAVVKVDRSAGDNAYLAADGRYRGDTAHFIELTRTLSSAFYVGPFRNAISEGAGNYYDMPIGTSFISRWDDWKTGVRREANEAAQRVADDIAHIFDFRRFEINATPDKKALQVIINGKPHRLRELGAGLAQFIIAFGSVATKRPSLLLFDEPELNLHPSLQIDFLTSLAAYATYGVAFASHSVGLARAVSDRIFTFQKQNEVGIVKPFEQTPNFAEFVGEMSFSSFKEVGCDRILLVEGVTEVKAVQQFLRALRKDHTTVLIPLGGSQMLRGGVQQELSELARLSKNVAVLIDSELENGGASLALSRQQFVEECRALGFKVHVTQKRAFENCLCDRAIKEEKGANFQALADYDRLADAAQGWAKSDNWRIARRMTRDEVLATDVGAFLDQI
jgi:energy-coupling factor transporter ATP-binding protein EcfA2